MEYFDCYRRELIISQKNNYLNLNENLQHIVQTSLFAKYFALLLERYDDGKQQTVSTLLS